uniref:Putative ixodes 26 kDa salivary protein n=1 Tax=Ixodes ricinus TaxID=34613 RepID=A0A0K8RKT5_IXORI
MKVLTKALTFALCLFCISAKPRPLRTNRQGVSREKIITISYLLDGNEFRDEDASNDSGVKHWLQEAQEEAQTLLKQQTKAEIKFDIINISLTDKELTGKLFNWTSMGSCGSESLMNAGTVLGEIKSESTHWPLRPHIICVLTKLKLYQDDLINLLALPMASVIWNNTSINATFEECLMTSTQDDCHVLNIFKRVGSKHTSILITCRPAILWCPFR